MSTDRDTSQLLDEFTEEDLEEVRRVRALNLTVADLDAPDMAALVERLVNKYSSVAIDKAAEILGPKQ
jgi:hypothetical protein